MSDPKPPPEDFPSTTSVMPLTHPRFERLKFEWVDEHNRATSARIFDRTTIGSSTGLTVRLADKANTVSRCHAEIVLREDGLWIRDLGSRNGTWLEGCRIESARLTAGVRLRVGNLSVQVVPDGSAPIALWSECSFGPLLGQSVVMRNMFATLAKVAPLDVPVLLQGETGTGKERVAEAIHQASPFRSGKFVVVDCGALAKSLAESELFGHQKGSFTGSVAEKVGLLESADGGTVFLDEIGELPMDMQPILLRFLESRMIRRVGDVAYKGIHARVIAATHKNLLAMMNRDPPLFREDLYFRVGVVPIRIPPLREHPEDIPMLIERFRPRDAAKLDDAMLARVTTHEWPGNVRQLRSFVERAAAIGAEASLEVTKIEDAHGAAPLVDATVSLDQAREHWDAHCEREYFTRLIATHGHDANAIAKTAGRDPSSIRRLLKRHALWHGAD